MGTRRQFIEQPCSAVFVEDQLVAVAGYEIWGSTIAHIATVTHPGFRQRGYGQSVMAHLTQKARQACCRNIGPLKTNFTSLPIAEALGFCFHAKSIAARFFVTPTRR
jgi:predicted GNAT family acetyltransferase